MNYICPLLVSFFIIFLAELGDKTQFLILSFSTKTKTKNIILGIALGSFISNGLAVIFGSKISSLFSEQTTFYLNIFTNLSFIFLGIIGLIFLFISFLNINKLDDRHFRKDNILSKFSKLNLPSSILLAILILIGELGDKTFLSSLALASTYPNSKILLVLGATLGMIISNLLTVFLGKLINSHFNYTVINILSNLTFIIFGFIGLVGA